MADLDLAHRRPAGRREDLGVEGLGFTKPHIVRQHAAEAEAVQEGHPAEAAELVGAQLALERRGLGNALGLVGRLFQELVDPLHAAEADGRGDAARGAELAEAEAGAEGFAERELAGRAAVHEFGGGAGGLGVDLDPPTVATHERLAGADQGAELAHVHLLAADRDLPIEAQERIKADAARPAHRLVERPKLHHDLDPGLLAPGPAGQADVEAGVVEGIRPSRGSCRTPRSG